MAKLVRKVKLGILTSPWRNGTIYQVGVIRMRITGFALSLPIIRREEQWKSDRASSRECELVGLRKLIAGE